MNINLILFGFLFLTFNAISQNTTLDIQVINGDKNPRKPNYWHINESGIISLLLNTDSTRKFRFSKISVQIVFESYHKFLFLFSYKKFIKVEGGEYYTTQKGYLECDSCGSHDLDNYISYKTISSNQLKISIPISKIETHDCLSRIILKIDEIKYMEQGVEKKLTNFPYYEKYSFWARWNKCREWAEFNSKDFIKKRN